MADGKKRTPPKPRLTIQDLMVELARNNYIVRLNDVTLKYDIEGTTPSGRKGNIDDIVSIMRNNLASEYTDCSRLNIEQNLVYIAREDHYNPVIEYMNGLKWDGIDRLPALYDLMRLAPADKLSRVLVYKWLLQSVALLFNGGKGYEQNTFGADGCLALNGKQHFGKTQLLKHLALQNNTWFGEGLKINRFDKDTTRRVITHWITELGEIGVSMEGNVEDLKNLITTAFDEYRLPYGRSDTTGPRHTSIGATCDTPKYLIDEAGNRRWWTVPISVPIPYPEIHAFDFEQLWAQIYSIVEPLPYDQKGACFRLTEDEQRQLSARNAGYERPVKGQDEIADILDTAYREKYEFVDMTVSDFKRDWPELRQFSAQQIGQALTRCGIPSPERPGGRERVRRLPKRPIGGR